MANINVNDLTAVDKLQDSDTLLLIRGEGAAKKCYRIAGSDFQGKSAFEVAKEAGYTGTEEDFKAQIKSVSDFNVSFDPATGCLTIGD